jgi:uncharacterized protein
LSARHVAWTPVSGVGLELVNLRQDERGNFIMNGEALWVHENEPFTAYYHIHCYPNWELQEVSLGLRRFQSSMVTPAVILARTRDGQWINHRNAPLPMFHGFTDVDISLTPLTNTIPIRRLGLNVGESREINVIYFEAPSLEPTPARQRYTCLKKNSNGGLYRLEWDEINFSADIPVDTDGLVLDYPDLFKRVWGK